MDRVTLTERLRGVVRAPARPPAPAEGEGGPEAVRPTPPGEPEERTGGIEAVLGGEWRTLAAGRAFVVERRMAASEPYGRTTIGGMASTVEAAAGEAAVLTSGRPASPFVFLDLETTGLSGGAGSVAFLVGCGWFGADAAFVTRQYLLVRIPDERQMLVAVAADLAAAGALVSFNGKSFDVPVLETRYALHRLDAGRLSEAPHFDVLHPARRFWAGPAGAAGGSCSLSSLEEQILRVRRVGDVPGAEIPWRYFQFVRSGNAGPLGGVLEHNRLDLVSLAGLTARLLQLVTEGVDAAWNAGEMLALGRAYARAGREAHAREALERAAAAAPRNATGLEARRWLALGARRARRHEEAARHWQTILNTPGCPAGLVREASEALAVHHEHRVRDLGMARTYALKSLVNAGQPRWSEATRYRLARLERKMSAPLLE